MSKPDKSEIIDRLNYRLANSLQSASVTLENLALYHERQDTADATRAIASTFWRTAQVARRGKLIEHFQIEGDA